jgi:hypothetical protein
MRGIGRVRFGLALAVALATIVVWPSGAGAFVAHIESASITPSATQAGGHPDLEVAISYEDPTPSTAPEWIVFEELPGWFNPWGLVRCSPADFAAAECPPSSQIGLMTLKGTYEGSKGLLGTVPIYSLATSDAFGELGFWVPLFNTPVTSSLSLRPVGSYPVWKIGPLPEEATISSLKAQLWGVPADPAHDASRFPTGSLAEPAGCPGIAGTSCTSGMPSGEPLVPFTIYATRCVDVGHTYIKTWSFPEEEPFNALESQVTTPAGTGCDKLSFDPAFEIGPTTTVADEFSGFDLQVTVPQTLTATALSPGELSEVTFVLPEEFALGAEPPPGLVACTEEEAGFFSQEEENCPAASKIGTAKVGLSITPEPLVGSIYLGTPAPNGSARLFFLTSGSGLYLKQLLNLKEDEVTGALIASFVQPLMPIESYELHVFGGEEGLFLTPRYCGVYDVPGTFESWAGESFARQLEEVFEIATGPNGGPCLGPPAEVVVDLQPGTILADGHSQTSVHLAVLDENGTALPGELLELSSSDSGQLISPIEELEDGTYEATIRASSTPGTSVITATDFTTEPELFGSAHLTQLDPNPTKQAPAAGSKSVPPAQAPRVTPRTPIVKFLQKPSHGTANRKPTFRFRADTSNAKFECALDKAAFRPCRSPLTFSRLPLGRHRFRVRAHVPGGTPGTPAVYRFTLRGR